MFKTISRKVLMGLAICGLAFSGSFEESRAAGLLTPSDGSTPALQIKSHDVKIVIQDGYAITSIEQVFHNPHNMDLEAIYSFPVPEKAAVSELTYWIDGQPITGEVLEKQQARTVYEDQKAQGREAAITEQDSYKTFDVSVTPVRANDDVRIRLGYMQPAHIDTGIGRYVYPLQENTVDEQKLAFWTANESVQERFSFDMTLRSSYPVEAVRLPKHPQASVTQTAEGDWNIRIESNGIPSASPMSAEDDVIMNEGFQPVDEEGKPVSLPNRSVASKKSSYELNTDIVMYWRLKEGLPGSVDMVTYKPDPSKKGVFMMTVTPGDDLKPITEGRDFVFVLDKSGSMRSGKFITLAHGVEQALQKMRPEDRFRIVLFDNTAREITNGFVNATPDQIASYISQLKATQSDGGTNLYAGLDMSLRHLDEDRTSTILLVTDGVANVGITQQKDFLKLVEQQDVRLHIFIMGNSANRPLLEAITKRSGGSSMSVSNSDDIVGAVMNAASRITHESMHDVDVVIKGVQTELVSPVTIGSLYRGEQLVIFGHYRGAGQADVTLNAKVSGQPVAYKTNFAFPETSTENPELERLWAFAKIEDLMQEIQDFGGDADLKQAVTDLAVEYSLVTPFTSMVVVREEVFKQLGIERLNQKRLTNEQQAQAQRLAQPVKQHRADHAKPMFNTPRASHSGGGGMGGGNIGLLGLLMAAIAWLKEKFGIRRPETEMA